MKLKFIFIIFIFISLGLSMGKTPNIFKPEQSFALLLNNENNQAEIIINNKQEVKELLNICRSKKSPVKQIFIELNELNIFPKELEQFLESFSKYNIEIYYLISAQNSPNAQKKIEKIISYNITNADGFAGILLDLNSKVTPSVEFMEKSIKTLEQAKATIARHKANLQLSAILPDSLWSEDDKYLPQYFNYLNFAVISSAKNIDQLLAYAEEIKTEIILETDSNKKQSLNELGEELRKKYKIFKMLALNYNNLKSLE